MNVDEIAEWREADREPGELVAVWNYEHQRESVGLVVKDDRLAESDPFGLETRIRKIHVFIGGTVEKLIKYDIFPVGFAQPEIPF